MQETGDINTSGNVIDWLSGYMRYVLDNNNFVNSLQNELEQVESYISIQNTRFSFNIVLIQNISPEVLFCAVPKMLFLTFVENTYKYARDGLSNVYLYINVRSVENRLEIQITDSGPGYPEEVIESVNEGKTIDGNGERIGLINIFERMKILYDGNVEYLIGNHKGHASAVITIPKIDIDAWKNRT